MTEREKRRDNEMHAQHQTHGEQRGAQQGHTIHEQQREGHQHGGAAEQHELIAHFPSLAQARQAAHAVNERVVSARIEEVSPQHVHEEAMSAQMGVATVEIGLPTWVGLAIGAIVGVVVGILLYSGRIALPGVAPALASGAVASVFFCASLYASAGALIGALLHLFRAPAPAPGMKCVRSSQKMPGRTCNSCCSKLGRSTC